MLAMSRLRVSAISFLNTAPLMWDFDHGERRREFEVAYTVPSACAEALRTGTADIGIIPVIAYATIPDLVVIPEVAIAAKGAVRSILLISKVPLDEVKTIAADTSSRTSVALLRVLLRKWHGGGRTFLPMEPKLEQMLKAADAALIIGDPALTVDRSKYVCYDLSEEWQSRTGKPFVFAFWAMRSAALAGQDQQAVARVFQESRDHGLEHVAELAREWAPRVGLSEDAVRIYLTENIDYALDAANLAGLNLFYKYAMDCGVIPDIRPVEFVGAGKTVASG
jgi:chorismate dehydratase